MDVSATGHASRSGAGAQSDRGSAAIEFIVIGVGLLVPLVYLALAAAAVQSAAFASTQAAREAGRAFTSSATVAEGRMRALAAARLAFTDHGLSLPVGALRISCADGPCLSPGSAVDVSLAWQVPLPWLPGSLADQVPARIPVEATQRVPVDDYRGDATP
jgi:hypothetical protein